MQKVNQDIKNKQFERVYLLFGEETFLVRSYKNRLKEAVTAGDTMNYHHFEGKQTQLGQVKDLAETVPFFADRRLIVLEDTGFFKTASEGWAEFIKELPETVCVLFAESEVDKRNRLYKSVNDVGYALELKRQSEGELKRWIVGMLGKNNLKITPDALERFIAMVGDDMERIRSELDKLAAYCMGQEGVTAQEVEAVCTEQTANRVFEMIEAMTAGKEAKALDLYYDLLALREPSMRILFLIARQFNQLMQIKEMLATGARQDQVASTLKLKPFIAGRLMNQARQFERSALREYVELCVASEEAVKTGNMNEKLAVEMVIVRISRHRM